MLRISLGGVQARFFIAFTVTVSVIVLENEGIIEPKSQDETGMI